MFEPIVFGAGNIMVHSFRPEELDRYDMLVDDIYTLLSDRRTLRYLPEKRLRTKAQAENWIKASILNFHCGRNYVHLISEQRSSKLLGIIDIISPETAEANYKLERYPYFIEFYLRPEATGCGLMSELLPRMLGQMSERGIAEIAAVVDRNNHAAARVLQRAGFQRCSSFDLSKDLFQRSINEDTDLIKRAG